MATPTTAKPAGKDADSPGRRLRRWLLAEPQRRAGPHTAGEEQTRPWWKVMCLTGVDYFSTLGYQPGIAALAAGVLSPVATLILVLLTLGGALPIYRRVARESPHGEGSIAMLERLLPWWQGKLFVLALLGFVATDFVITITLSSADAAAHALENPFLPGFLSGRAIPITLFLIAILGAVFLKGFKEAIGIAVGLVGVYLALNAVVIAVALRHLFADPGAVGDWRRALFAEHGNPLAMIGIALLLFPKLALGLSGFETGVAVMPLVQGEGDDTEEEPRGRVRNTRRLLLVAAGIMSVFLLTSSFATITLIPREEFAAGGQASGRALAFLAHRYLGDIFGTVYDISTIAILWFAGASAMAGLLNIVPRYLPRYGMAPAWARASRPLVAVVMVVAFAVTLLFRASVEAQGGAYATGVLVLMSSAAVAVTIAARGARQGWRVPGYGLIAAIFIYTTIVNIFERPEGVKIAACFIAAIVVVSLASRLGRSTELRTTRISLDESARRFVEEVRQGPVYLLASEPFACTEGEYRDKEERHRAEHHLPADEPILFLEVAVRDASEFAGKLTVRGETVGDYRVLRAESAAVPNALAALLLHLRDATGHIPEAYFNWTEESPPAALARYVLFGQGDIAPVTHEVLRRAEPDPARRPVIHVA